MIKGLEFSTKLDFDPDVKSHINQENKPVQIIIHEATAGAKINEESVEEGSRVKIDKQSLITGVKTAIVMIFHSKS